MECSNCHKDIGFEEPYKLYKTSNRIYFDIEQKKKYQNIEYKGKIYSIQGIILEDLRKKIKIKKGFFYNKRPKNKNYSVRNLNTISYIILSFILNSNIFYSCLLGNDSRIKIDDIQNNIFAHWLELKKNLQLYNINIQIFLNTIFNDFENSIKNIKDFNTPESRHLFENNFNNNII